MGGAMALRLLEQGYDVGVRDIDATREAELVRQGARAFATPAALAAAHRVVIVAVVDAAQCEAVLFGADGVASASTAGARLLPAWPSAASTASTHRCRAARHALATAA